MCKKICAVAKSIWSSTVQLDNPQPDPPQRPSPSPTSAEGERVRLVETIADAAQTYPKGTEGRLLGELDGLVEVLLDGFPSRLKLFPSDIEPISTPKVAPERIWLVETVADANATYPAGTWGKILAVRDGLVEVLLDGFANPVSLFSTDFQSA